MKMQIRLFFFAVCIAALAPIGMLTAQAKAPIKECRASPSKAQGHWSWRLIDGRKCWYAGKTVIPKSALRWPAAEPAQAKVKAAPPVGVAAEKRGDPMNAQARMLDDDSFESRWRARVSTEQVRRSLPSPLVGEGAVAKRRRKGYISASLASVENPSSDASRHLLPQGEKGRRVAR